jgi:hypothetical protein
MSYTYTINNTTIPNNLTLTGTVTAGTGSTIYTTGTNGWITSSNPYEVVMTVNQTKPATLEVKGNMVINGRDLEERLDTIEKVLQIPERDVKLEKKYPKLKKLHDEYIHALGKYRTFEAIKGDDDGTT